MSSTTLVNPPNGEVVIGDKDYDGRVILYIIKGPDTPVVAKEVYTYLFFIQRIKRPTSITSSH